MSDTTYHNVTSITLKEDQYNNSKWTVLRINKVDGTQDTVTFFADADEWVVVPGSAPADTDNEPHHFCVGIDKGVLVDSYRSALVNTVHTCQEWGSNGETGSPDAEEIFDTNVHMQVDQLAGTYNRKYADVLEAMEAAVNRADAMLPPDNTMAHNRLVVSFDCPDARRDLHGGLANYVVGKVLGTERMEGCDRYQLQVEMAVVDGIQKWRGHEGRMVYPPVNGTPTSLGRTCNGVVEL
jgi:hypothetical protein